MENGASPRRYADPDESIIIALCGANHHSQQLCSWRSARGIIVERPDSYIPMDRRQAMARNAALPDRTHGAALFADISGFTSLTEDLARELGPRRGAEEITRYLNMVYDALINELHLFGGSVISFGGDAITCWFDTDPGARAVACALAMQHAMKRFATFDMPSGGTLSFAMKIAVATGPARRFIVGDPHIKRLDVLAGEILDRLASAERHADRGEVVLDPTTTKSLADDVSIAASRVDDVTGERFGIVADVKTAVRPSPWPSITPRAIDEEQIRPWLLPPVYERLQSGQGEFLAELRPVVALFLTFNGIDYDGDDEAGAKLDTYIRQVQRILLQYGAYLLQINIGDKGNSLYAAFGAPLAYEDDVVRAATAALDLQALTPKLDFISRTRIGVSQGRAYTGAFGANVRRVYGVQGDDVNLAARLMQAAEPGQILVSNVSRQATAELFTWDDLPDIMVRGKAEPVSVSNLTGLRQRRATRIQATQYTLPMVGRESELNLVIDKLREVRKGRGQIIGITGEAGIGKSRLVAEAVRIAGDWQLVGYSGECQSYGTNSSYLVWHNVWRGFFDLDVSAPLEQQERLLEAQLARIDPTLVPRLPLLGTLLNTPLRDNELTHSLDAKLRKSSLEALLVDCIRARAEKTLLLLVLEDCHWLDPLSHELLEIIGHAIVNLPVLIIMAYRPPEFDRSRQPRVSKLSHFTEVRLSEFTPTETQRLVTRKLQQFYDTQTHAPDALIERIVERADGNPFYIEELLNYLHDRDVDVLDSPALEQLDLPNSLHSLILSRIDQLSESQKTTLKLASVIGRLFQAAILWGAYSQLNDAKSVKADLEVLDRLELTVLDADPELTYLFKHIVTQEVTYESLPYATRATLHDQIAQFIENTYGDSLDQVIDLLAYHYDHSENGSKKQEYLLLAGEAARASYANDAAINYFKRLIPLLPAEEVGAVMLKLGQVLELVGSWDEAAAWYKRALEAANRLEDKAARAWSQTAIGELLRKQGQYDDATLWLAHAQATFEEIADQAGVGQVLHFAGSLAAQQGEYETARDRYEKSLAIRRELDDKSNIGSLLSNLGIIARFQGNYVLARALHEEGLAIRRELGDRSAIAVSLNNLGNVALDQGDHAEARLRLEEAVALQRQVGDKQYIANVLNNLGNVARDQNDFDSARLLYDESLVLNQRLGDRWQLAYLLSDIGRLAACQGKADRALKLVGAATTLRELIGAPLSGVEQEKLEQALQPARQLLSKADQESAVTEGKGMSLEEAIDFAHAQ